MRPPSKRELDELAERYGIEIRDGEDSELVEQVATLLDGLDRLNSMNVRSDEQAPGERTWWGPQNDPPQRAHLGV